MSNVVSNAAKVIMIEAISGTDLNIALLNNVVLSADDFKRGISNWSTLSAFEISASGYTAGGITLSGLSAYSITPPDYSYFNGNSIIWPSVTLSAYGYALYRTVSGLIVGIVTFSGVSDGNPKTSTSGPFSISWNSNQILQMIG